MALMETQPGMVQVEAVEMEGEGKVALVVETEMVMVVETAVEEELGELVVSEV